MRSGGSLLGTLIFLGSVVWLVADPEGFASFAADAASRFADFAAAHFPGLLDSFENAVGRFIAVFKEKTGAAGGGPASPTAAVQTASYARDLVLTVVIGRGV